MILMVYPTKAKALPAGFSKRIYEPLKPFFRDLFLNNSQVRFKQFFESELVLFMWQRYQEAGMLTHYLDGLKPTEREVLLQELANISM